MSEFESSKLYQAIKDKNTNDVKELLTNGENSSIRDKDGTTLLHAAVKLGAPVDIFKLLLNKVDMTIRSCDGQTVADLIFSKDYNCPAEAETVLKEHTLQEIMNAKSDKLEAMILSGWSYWPLTIDYARDTCQEVSDFMASLPEFQGQVQKIHEAVDKENIRDLKMLLERKKLTQAADKTGLPPLQKAVLFGKVDVVKEMIKEFSFTLNQQDGMGRTSLHYAAGKHDGGHLYELLKKAGADETVKDINGCTPKDYYEDPTKIGTAALQDKIQELQESSTPTSKQSVQTETRALSAKSNGRSSGSGHRIYISKDTRPRTGTAPSTVDGKYVAQHLGTALTLALAEIAERRPKDPVEYLSMWLYKYRENMDHNTMQENLIQDLQRAEEERVKDAERKEKIKTERLQLEEEERQRKIKEEEDRKKKEQEELQRKAKEAALAQRPNLETVTEEGEEETPSKEKDSQGQTELHRLAGQEGADIRTLINMGYSIAERDAEQRTARDIAEKAGIKDNIEAIDNYVQDLLKEEKFDELEQLVLDSYDKLETVLATIADQSEDIKKFAASLPDFMTKITETFTAVQKGVLRDVQQAVERKKLATARDGMGRCPLHVAVLTENEDVVGYIVQTFPNTVKCRDHMNRTPLHYAMGLNNEDLITLLLANDADTTIKDVLKRTPSDYRDNNEDIKSMKENLVRTNAQQESEGQSQQEEDTSQQKTTDGEATQQQEAKEGETSQQQEQQ